MILLTGAAGFIGSCMLSYLNKMGHHDVILVDDFDQHRKDNNWKRLEFHSIIHRNDLDENKLDGLDLECIIHLGARTDTAESDQAIFDELNLEYSKKLWITCIRKNITFIYASSAATYGDGALGYEDSHDIVSSLQPLNPYGESKNEFDKWILKQNITPPYWYGFKFFNVYGPNEYHKGRMASVIFHCYRQIQETQQMKLFRSHHPDFKDGEQKRDFIHVEDVVSTLYHFMESTPQTGIYNLGTGQARTFLDLVENVFHSLNITPRIGFIDTPIDIRENYQYFTEADVKKLSSASVLVHEFKTLEQGIREYVQDYLTQQKYF